MGLCVSSLLNTVWSKYRCCSIHSPVSHHKTQSKYPGLQHTGMSSIAGRQYFTHTLLVRPSVWISTAHTKHRDDNMHVDNAWTLRSAQERTYPRERSTCITKIYGWDSIRRLVYFPLLFYEISRLLFEDFEADYFWKWNDFSSYIEFLALFAVTVGMITRLLIDVPAYIEGLGLTSVFAEAMLGAPQFYRNFVNKSTEGMRWVLLMLDQKTIWLFCNCWKVSRW